MLFVSRTRATFRLAEFGLRGAITLTCRHSPALLGRRSLPHHTPALGVVGPVERRGLDLLARPPPSLADELLNSGQDDSLPKVNGYCAGNERMSRNNYSTSRLLYSLPPRRAECRKHPHSARRTEYTGTRPPQSKRGRTCKSCMPTKTTLTHFPPLSSAQAGGRVYDGTGSELGRTPQPCMIHPVSTSLARLLAVILLVFANGFFVATEFALVAVAPHPDRGACRPRPPVGPGRAACHLPPRCLPRRLSVGYHASPPSASAGLANRRSPRSSSPRLRFLPDTWAVISAHTLARDHSLHDHHRPPHCPRRAGAEEASPSSAPMGPPLAVARPIEAFLFIFKPAIVTLNGLGNLLVRSIGLQPMTEEERVHSVEELRYLVSASGEAGLVGAEAIGNRRACLRI